MASIRETYKSTLSFEIKEQSVADDTLLGIPVEIQCSIGIFTVTISVGSAPSLLKIDLDWSFEDWYAELSGNEVDKTERSIDLWKSSGCLHLPREEDSILGLNERPSIWVKASMLAIAWPYFKRLALVARNPYFLQAIRSQLVDGEMPAPAVTVAGETFLLDARVHWSRSRSRTCAVGASVARELARGNPSYVSFLTAADHQNADGQLMDAVVHLAQALEIAVYAFLKVHKITVHKNNRNFKARTHFGPKRYAEIAARQPMDLAAFPKICELMGTRHEWIHNGNALVRAYDQTAGDCSSDSAKYRPIQATDYGDFRSAVSQALEWLGELPIELTTG